MNHSQLFQLILQIKSTKPDNFTPKIVEKRDDYVRVEYESPILGVLTVLTIPFMLTVFSLIPIDRTVCNN